MTGKALKKTLWKLNMQHCEVMQYCENCTKVKQEKSKEKIMSSVIEEEFSPACPKDIIKKKTTAQK